MFLYNIENYFIVGSEESLSRERLRGGGERQTYSV